MTPAVDDVVKPFKETTRRVRESLCAVFTEIDQWFDRSETVRCFAPTSGRWSIDQVLEHVSMTNRFLLMTVQKWSRIAIKRSGRGDPAPTSESDLNRIEIIGERGSFGWERPEHMEPKSEATSSEVRRLIREQLGECMIALERLRGGTGAQCKITMTVNALGKIDLYQWLYFIAQHAKRHLAQLSEIEAEFYKASTAAA